MSLYAVVVKVGKMGSTQRISVKDPDLDVSDYCIVKTDRGTEWATVVSLPVVADDLREVNTRGFKRKATPEDLETYNSNLDWEMDVMNTADEMIEDLKMDLHLSACEVTFGRERAILYFTSEKRVDFRNLVRQLSSKLNVRVEMRQLSARETGRLLGTIGTCGQELCCRTFIKGRFKPVSMKFARLQLSSLQAEKLSGACGRLKCCLRYEYEMYQDLAKALPKKKSNVQLRDGRQGFVLDQNILDQSLVLNVAGDRMVVPLDDLDLNPEKKGGCGGGGGCSTQN